MSKVNLEKFDSPIVMINKTHEHEDWGVTARYVSKQDVMEKEGKVNLAEIGWYISVNLPDFDDVDFDQVFSTLDAALEFGTDQIVSGSLRSVNRLKGEGHSFTHYQSIAC